MLLRVGEHLERRRHRGEVDLGGDQRGHIDLALSDGLQAGGELLGYTPEEFAASLQSIAESAIDVAPLITAEVGLPEVPAAFEMLANPEQHCKILVVPGAGAS